MTDQGKEVALADCPVAILAGGLSTRLRPQTDKVPKSLLKVAGQPFLLHQLRLLHSEGIRRVVLCVGYLGEMIEAELGKVSDLGMQIDYSLDGPTLLGTGGALKRALPKLGERFIVIYGDSYVPLDYSEVVAAFVSSAKPGLITVFQNENRWDVSNVWFEHGEIQRYDKKVRTVEMRHIDCGVGVLSAEAFASFPDHVPFDLADVYSRLVSERRMAGYEVKQRFYEIGSPEGLAELDSLLRNKHVLISP